MGRRLDFQTLLEELSGRSAEVYFQPSPSTQISYPAIVYNRDSLVTAFADDSPYRNTTRYQVTVIDPDPDSSLPDLVALLPMTRFVRHYTTEGLNHDIYDVYF